MTWATYREYFSFSKCGMWSLFLLVIYHVIINLTTMSVGFYLAFTLSSRVGKADESSGWAYQVILCVIMVCSIATSFAGKYLSNKIVSTY